VDAQYLDRHLATGASVAAIKPLHQQAPAEMPPEERAAAAVASDARAKAGDCSAPVNEVFNQIAFADIVLLNKIDLVSDEAAVNVERAIREINSLARVVHTRLNDDDCPNWLSTVCS
jgi:G3E family GTPase